MSEAIIIALITGSFAFMGTLLTVKSGNKQTKKQIDEQNELTIYRIKQLEKKVEKHNSVVERMFIAEGRIKELQHEVRDLKEGG